MDEHLKKDFYEQEKNNPLEQNMPFYNNVLDLASKSSFGFALGAALGVILNFILNSKFSLENAYFTHFVFCGSLLGISFNKLLDVIFSNIITPITKPIMFYFSIAEIVLDSKLGLLDKYEAQALINEKVLDRHKPKDITKLGDDAKQLEAKAEKKFKEIKRLEQISFLEEQEKEIKNEIQYIKHLSEYLQSIPNIDKSITEIKSKIALIEPIHENALKNIEKALKALKEKSIITSIQEERKELQQLLQDIKIKIPNLTKEENSQLGILGILLQKKYPYK